MENNNAIFLINEYTKGKVEKLCDFILIDEDHLEVSPEIENFINEIIKETKEGQKFSGTQSEINNIVQSKIREYLSKGTSLVKLFAYSGDNGFWKFQINFVYFYIKCIARDNNIDIKNNLKALGPLKDQFPKVFIYVFDCVQYAIDFYNYYDYLSLKMTQNVVDQATKQAEQATAEARNACEDTLTKVSLAELRAKNLAEKSAGKAVRKAVDDQFIEKQLRKSIDKEIDKVKLRLTENSVTILGIFSGIVLTVVAGLFYSSSVLDNINSANFYKLLSLSAAIGIVCISLITIMFNFVYRLNHISEPTEDKDKNKDKDTDKKDTDKDKDKDEDKDEGKDKGKGKIKHKFVALDVTFIIVISILLVMVVVGLVFYKLNPEEKLINSENSINANINVSGLYNEDKAKTTFIDENNNLTTNLDEAASVMNKVDQSE